MSKLEYDKITLEDIETAISILEHFYYKMKRAEMVLQRFKTMQGRTGIGGMGFTMEDIIGMATEVQRRKEGKPPEEIPIGDLSPEEIAKMKELVKKVRTENK